MRGGQKGLFVNSRDICAKRYRANANLKAQNGRRRGLRPKLWNKRCKKWRRKHKGRHRGGKKG